MAVLLSRVDAGNLDNQRDYWNRIGPSKPFSHQANIGRLRDLLRPDSRILDFGCGYGRVLGQLYESGYTNLIGVDTAPAMVDAARLRFPGISFQQVVNPPNLAVADASVDAVLVFAVLTCVPSDHGQRSIMREIRRFLRPSGVLYISDLWLQTDIRNLQRYEQGHAKYGTYGVFDLPEGVTLRHHDRRWIETLTNGFERLALDEIEVQTMNGNVANGFQWLGLRGNSIVNGQSND